MCALGHFLEEEGLATVSISLVRPHVEAVQPPRSLWVPFELGRPLGAPNDPAFQRRVIMAALALLESKDGPVVLADYPEDAPSSGESSESSEAWACPVNLKPPVAAGWKRDPWRPCSKRSEACCHGMKSQPKTAAVQQSGSPASTSPKPRASWRRTWTDDPEPSYRDSLSVGDALKLATEDIKAFYLEAATAKPGAVSSKELIDWFWGETTAGQVFLRLKKVCAGIDDPMAQAMAGHSLVPRSQQHRLPQD